MLIRKNQKNNCLTGVSKKSMTFFGWQNNVPMNGSLKASIMGFLPEILNVYFFETPLVSNNSILRDFYIDVNPPSTLIF